MEQCKITVSENVVQVKDSPTLKVNAISNKYKKEGKTIYDLGMLKGNNIIHALNELFLLI